MVTNSADLADKVREYGNFCYGKEQKFMHEGIGYNYRLSNINAAVGVGQLQRIDSILARKQYIYQHYEEWMSAPGSLPSEDSPLGQKRHVDVQCPCGGAISIDPG